MIELLHYFRVIPTIGIVCLGCVPRMHLKIPLISDRFNVGRQYTRRKLKHTYMTYVSLPCMYRHCVCPVFLVSKDTLDVPIHPYHTILHRYMYRYRVYLVFQVSNDTLEISTHPYHTILHRYMYRHCVCLVFLVSEDTVDIPTHPYCTIQHRCTMFVLCSKYLKILLRSRLIPTLLYDIDTCTGTVRMKH